MTSTLLPQIVNGDEVFDRYAAAAAGQETDHVLRLWAYATLLVGQGRRRWALVCESKCRQRAIVAVI